MGISGYLCLSPAAVVRYNPLSLIGHLLGQQNWDDGTQNQPAERPCGGDHHQARPPCRRWRWGPSEGATFGECADRLIEAMRPSWRNGKHAAQWEMTLRDYAAPLRRLPVNKITTDDVLSVLKPIWNEKPETAARLRGRIERVLDAAKAQGLRSGENPARWRGHLDQLLPRRQRLTRGHHAAMSYIDVPAFIADLQTRQATAALALEFAILTAARSGEVLGAGWAEFDLERAIWTIPAGRMKAGREHRVPLSRRALKIVKTMHEVRDGDFAFPGQKAGKPLSV